MRGSRFLIGSLLFVSTCYAQLTLPGKINPHRAESCQSCHIDGQKPAANNFIETACDDCHTRQAVNSKIHQLDNINVQAQGISIPADFPIKKAGEFSCLTCHTVVCKTDRANQTFLRGGPYQTELDFCFTCHEKSTYTPLNPHIQLRQNGALDESTCLHCHVETPDESSLSTKKSEMHLEMTPTCNKCHALHRHEQQHIGKSIDAQKRILAKTEAKYGIAFPVSVENTIQCNTCHYTHERSVLQKDNVVYGEGGDNAWSLRLAKEQLCFACHDL